MLSILSKPASSMVSRMHSKRVSRSGIVALLAEDVVFWVRECGGVGILELLFEVALSMGVGIRDSEVISADIA
jgi:hypothetical protein